MRDLFRKVVPEATRARWQLRLLVRQQWRKGEGELRLLADLVDPGRAAFDVGANRGLYSWYLRRLTSEVHAFEPQPRLARRLRFALGSSVHVHNVALSNTSGRVLLRIPCEGQDAIDGYASLQEGTMRAWRDSWSEQSIEVERLPLDAMALPEPGFIKIDVEGHETEVLEGARQTLQRARPVLLMELDERNRPGTLHDVPRQLAALGYRGSFLLEGKLVPLERFEPQRHQNPDNVGVSGALPGKCFINNFIFLPEPEAESRARHIAAHVDG